MKISVYAISKNESKFVDRWMDSMSEADEIVVLDTGSEDDTVEKLIRRGAIVKSEIINPWRFDVARNRSMELVSADADICVCTDLDEVFDKGWRNELEKVWYKGAGQAVYRYAWSVLPDGSDGVSFWYEKIHERNGYRWTHPVHEILERTDGKPSVKVRAEGVHLKHYPDPEKSRAQYLSLLEMSVKESPEDDRNMHYLGREYMFRGRWDDCIKTLMRHLEMPSATWKDERAASMRFIARSYANKGDTASARDWYLRAIAEAPYLREAYVESARLLYTLGEWDGVIYFASCALKIKERPETYMNDAEAWGALPYDLRSIAYYYTGRYEKALDDVKKALEHSPNDCRLQTNERLIAAKCGDTVK